jgi:hypothetical protein
VFSPRCIFPGEIGDRRSVSKRDAQFHGRKSRRCDINIITDDRYDAWRKREFHVDAVALTARLCISYERLIFRISTSPVSLALSSNSVNFSVPAQSSVCVLTMPRGSFLKSVNEVANQVTDE